MRPVNRIRQTGIRPGWRSILLLGLLLTFIAQQSPAAAVANAAASEAVRAVLQEKLKQAYELDRRTPEGEKAGEYPASFKKKLADALRAAELADNDPNSGDLELEWAQTQLSEAVKLLEGTRITKLTNRPDKPVLLHDNMTGVHTYNMTINVWWGNNGTLWKLYERLEGQPYRVIAEGSAVDLTPTPQMIQIPLRNKASGAYTYYAELTNALGTTNSDALSITLYDQGGKDGEPAVPMLASFLDASGGFKVQMDIWWGSNGTSWKLYEKQPNGEFAVVRTGTMPDRTPEPQSVAQIFHDKTYGTYTYYTEFSNAYGVTRSEPLTVEYAAPWYRTWWAIALYLLIPLLGAGVHQLWRLRDQRRHMAAQARELQRQYEINRQLQRLDALKDEFLARTSHELRTPLHGMIGLTEAMIDGADGPLPPSAMERLGLVVESGRRLSRLINDILDFERAKNGDLALFPRPVDMRSAVDLVFRQLRPLAAGKPVALSNEIGGDVPSVYADEDRIVQVLHNLIGNAIKYTREGSIAVKAEPEPGQNRLRIIVEDTGIGILPEQMEVIFKPFEQGIHPVTGRYEGTGLGLPIARHVIERHGGTMTVTSEAEKGSRFAFTLPLCPQAGQAVSPAAPEPAPPDETDSLAAFVKLPLPLAQDGGLPGEAAAVVPASASEAASTGSWRVVAVDDDPVNLQVLAGYAAAKPWDLQLAADGEAALNLVAQGGVDLVLLDVMMPGLSGYEVCKRIRRRFGADELPVLLLTARTRPEDAAEGLRCGANDYIAKPFAKEELMARIETQLSAAAASRGLREANRQLAEEMDIRLRMDGLLERLFAVYRASELRVRLAAETESLAGIAGAQIVPVRKADLSLPPQTEPASGHEEHDVDQATPEWLEEQDTDHAVPEWLERLRGQGALLGLGEWTPLEDGCVLPLGDPGDGLELLWLPVPLPALTTRQRMTLQLLAKYTAVFYENLHLIEGMARRLEDLQREDQTPAWMSRLFMQLSEHERRRLSADLHDEVLQEALRLGNRVRAWNPSGTTEESERFRRQFQAGLEDIEYRIRETCSVLLPPMLAEKGVAQAVRELVDRLGLRHNVRVDLSLPRPHRPLQTEETLAVYRIVQELLTNAEKHAGATEIVLSLEHRGDYYVIRYRDNGQGLSAAAGGSLDQGTPSSLGLEGIRQRVRALSGHVEFADADGSGFGAVCRFPLKRYYEAAL